MRAFAVRLRAACLGGAALAQSRARRSARTIAQCDALIRASPTLAAYERRGYLHLMQRRGLEDLEKAIADFSAAMRRCEARPLSLYARGMARLMSRRLRGAERNGSRDHDAADIDEEFKRYGAE